VIVIPKVKKTFSSDGVNARAPKTKAIGIKIEAKENTENIDTIVE
jgi:hypothetical protein